MKITASRLSTLLAIGENMNIEFKKASDGPKADTFESVCAFLNKTGALLRRVNVDRYDDRVTKKLLGNR